MAQSTPSSAKRFIAAVFAVALGLLCTPAWSQSPAESGQSWYAVEVVIFRQQEAGGQDAEYWPQPVSQPAADHLATLGPVASGEDAPAFSRLPDTELQLNDISERLAHSKDYEVLLHVGWRQPGLGPDRAPAVVLPLDWSPPSSPPEAFPNPQGTAIGQSPFDYRPPGTRLWGTLRLLRERYLHFQVDLRLRDESGDGSNGVEGDAATIYPMIQSRRMRVGELHYLDHPVLGVLVQVRELPPRHVDESAP